MDYLSFVLVGGAFLWIIACFVWNFISLSLSNRR